MSDSQKFISRNRAPRVQIEYDVELYGAEKTVQLPFVMGVFADLSGKAEVPQVADRKFLEIDSDTFDDRMKAMAPRALFSVPNTLTGEGNLAVDLTFEKMSDFTPEAIAERVGALAPLLEARRQLSDLMAYMDGKAGAEALIESLLGSPALLTALTRPTDEGSDMAAALADLKARLPDRTTAEDTSAATLAALSAKGDAAGDRAPGVEDILARIEPAVVAPAEDTPDALAALRAATPVEAEAGADEASDVLSGIVRTEKTAPEDDSEATLASMVSDAPETAERGPGVEDILGGIAPAETDQLAAETDELENVLSRLEAPAEPAPEDGIDDLDALLGDLSADPPEEPSASDAPEAEHLVSADDALDDLDALLGDLSDLSDVDTSEPEQAVGEETPSPTASAEDALDDLDALLGDLDRDPAAEDSPEPAQPAMADGTAPSAPADGTDDLDALLSDLGGDPSDAVGPEQDGAGAPEPAAATEMDDLDALLGDLDGDLPSEKAIDDAAAEPEAPPTRKGDELDDLDALLADLGGGTDAPETSSGPAAPEPEAAAGPADDLDALMAELDTAGEPAGTAVSEPNAAEAAAVAPAPAPRAAPVQRPFGMISAPRPEREALNRRRFRMGLFGDFTGRASRGLFAIGDDLATREAIALDVDTVDEVIEGFATTLTLPIGRDGAGIAVKLGALDDLHPDELYDNVEIFEALAGLRQQLGVGSMAGKATERLAAWGESFGTPVRLPKRSASTAIPAGIRLSDFQALIGDTRGQPSQAGPIDDLIARIVGPHVVKAPDAGAAAMQAAVDEALGSAMRLVLHHPDFQAVEAQWRSLDMLARRIETDSALEIVLYDVSAAEIAADLAAQEDLSKSGLFRLLTDVLDPEAGAGGFSALFGLYTFEETPPHAELLARLAQVAGHVDAPFFTAVAPGYLDTAKEDRHPLVAQAWDALRAMPEAGHVGLASPRFLLRLPYGAKSDPCSAFDFEEFTPHEGLSGMLWGNPVVAVAILLAATHRKDGKAMQPGSLMSLGDMPFHYVTDRHGDQVALPCTERNLTSDPVQQSLARGIMPLVSMKGRNEVRLASFRALGGDTIAGPWSGDRPPAPTPPPDTGNLQMTIAAPTAPDISDTSAQDAALDDILASFDEDQTVDTADDDAMDPELAALLEDL